MYACMYVYASLYIYVYRYRYVVPPKKQHCLNLLVWGLGFMVSANTPFSISLFFHGGVGGVYNYIRRAISYPLAILSETGLVTTRHVNAERASSLY